MKISTKQESMAKDLLKKHDKKAVFVNTKSGHMHFTENSALIGAGDKDDLLVVVTNKGVGEFKRTVKIEEDGSGEASKPKTIKEEVKEAIMEVVDENEKPSFGSTSKKPVKTTAPARYPEGDPKQEWKEVELRNYAQDHEVALEEADKTKAQVLAKIQEKAKGSETPGE